MTRIQLALFFLVFAVAAGGFVVWRLDEQEKYQQNLPEREHLAVVLDMSTSVEQQCAALPGIIETALQGMSEAKSSRFALIPTAASGSSFEPQLAFEVAIPNGRKDNVFSNAGSRRKFLDEIQAKCEQLPAADASSIYRAVEIAMAHLQGLGCSGPQECRLIVRSDLEENSNPAIRDRVYAGATVNAPALLDNARIEVGFCDYTATASTGGPRLHAQNLVAGWRDLFTQPGAVSFQPYCHDFVAGVR